MMVRTFLGRVVEFTSLGNGRGELSFNKLVTSCALAVFAVAVVRRLEPGWPLLSFGIVVIGAGFGLKGYLSAVSQNKIDATVTHDVKLTGDLTAITTAVLARRDTVDGVEPT